MLWSVLWYQSGSSCSRYVVCVLCGHGHNAHFWHEPGNGKVNGKYMFSMLTPIFVCIFKHEAYNRTAEYICKEVAVCLCVCVCILYIKSEYNRGCIKYHTAYHFPICKYLCSSLLFLFQNDIYVFYWQATIALQLNN